MNTRNAEPISMVLETARNARVRKLADLFSEVEVSGEAIWLNVIDRAGRRWEMFPSVQTFGLTRSEVFGPDFWPLAERLAVTGPSTREAARYFREQERFCTALFDEEVADRIFTKGGGQGPLEVWLELGGLWRDGVRRQAAVNRIPARGLFARLLAEPDRPFCAAMKSLVFEIRDSGVVWMWPDAADRELSLAEARASAVLGRSLPLDPEFPGHSIRVDYWTISLLDLWISQHGSSADFWPLMRRVINFGCTLEEAIWVLKECNQLLDFGCSTLEAQIQVVRENLFDPPMVETRDGRSISSYRLLGFLSEESPGNAMLPTCLETSLMGAIDRAHTSGA